MWEEDRLKEILAEQLSINERLLSRDLSLDSLAIDSLEMLELVVAIEHEFDISLDGEQFGQCDTLGEMADLLVEKIRG